MKFNKQIIDKILMYVSIIVFIILTLLKLKHHIPWADEASAWIIAKDLSFENVLNTLHIEGHFIIWYLLLLPFAKLNINYPYSMLLINWTAYIFAIIIMWKKAPFNSFTKIAITFSWISLNYFPIIARCYSIGVLGLFILASLYEKQIKKPYIYSITLVLTAHTSLLATLAVIPLAGIFLYNLYKNKNELQLNNIIYPTIILAIGVFLWFLPFLNGYGYESGDIYEKADFYSIIRSFKSYTGYWYLYCYLTLLVIMQFFANNKIRIFFNFSTIAFIIFFSFIHKATPHHSIFLIIYLIIAFWLTPKLHKINLKTILFFVLFIALLYRNNLYNTRYLINNPNKRPIVDFIYKQNKTGYIFIIYPDIDIIPYLQKYEMQIINPELIKTPELLEKDVKKYIIEDGKFERGYLITNAPINNNSKEIKIYSDSIYIFYVTIYDES